MARTYLAKVVRARDQGVIGWASLCDLPLRGRFRLRWTEWQAASTLRRGLQMEQVWAVPVPAAHDAQGPYDA